MFDKMIDVGSEMMKWWQHFKTITNHKLLVMKHCFKAGLYWQGLVHDLSKYSWTEFSVGAKYYQGNRSPNDAEREAKGYTSAWLHHKGRNKHHLEYWIDYSKNKQEGLTGMKMPDKYIIEMFCDRMAACKNYQKDSYTDRNPLDYYERGRSKYLLHPYTRAKLELLLHMLADHGEDYTFAYCRVWIRKWRRYRMKQFLKQHFQK
jgi:hypothetical protein